ncbi:isoleucine--tRNA ligase, partial [Candidatus Micrarchaeota archaeon]|nr:isoleucine--tRNA ligase [Candidatus Micrarchaeota archaeon]
MYKPIEIEKSIADFWSQNKVYEKIKEKNKKNQKWYFCDGPPYATGQIHPGTAWNKSIKDAICRYMRSRGFNVRAQPGFDTHGLPIEVKVEQELKLGSKKDIETIGILKFIERCKAFATQYIDVMTNQFKSIGIWLDWEKPYITYKDEYIEKSWQTIKQAEEKNLLEKGIYVLPYCPRCETTMANYELEYDDRDDPSIYVKFKVQGKENEYLIIWTTTPWTLVANMAVMAHPLFNYVKIKVDNETWILAKERVNAIMALAGELGKSAIVLGEFTGKKLEGLEYLNPLASKVPKQATTSHRIVLSDEFVTLEEGTGLVHCAPGHGPQDFIVGKIYKLEPFCPVNTTGRYTNEGGSYEGMFVKDADKQIIKDLKESNNLIYSGRIRHRYPHCWRCKTQLIFITTDQWFIKISKVKDSMLSEIKNVRWQPLFASTWFTDFINSAPDWCISRQRFWGIPLPIWICEKCKKIKVIGSKQELGVEIKELHRPFIDEVTLDCTCSGKMKRVPDVLDVWFDSGNAVWASLEKGEEKWYPSDFIVEGKDQIRGWFYSLLGSGIVHKGEIPYKSLLMHGFFVDEKGEKMSKSVGNFVPLEEILSKYGADTFRFWSMGSTIWEDLKFNWLELKEASRVLAIYWNLSIFLERFYQKSENVKYEIEDYWLLSKLNSLVKFSTEKFDEYSLHEATRRYKDFIVEDLSRFYLKILKKRVNDNNNPEGALSALYTTLFTLLKLTSPITPFISESIYQKFFRKFENVESISMFEWPSTNLKLINPMLEKEVDTTDSIVAICANIRQAKNVKLRWPLEEVVIATNAAEVTSAVNNLANVLKTMCNVKNVRVTEKFQANEDYGSNEFPTGTIYLKTKINQELYMEAMRREVARRVQIMRKEMNLVEKDLITVNIISKSELASIIEKEKNELMKDVNAKDIIISKEPKLEGTKKEWDIEDEKIEIIVKKI